MKETHLLIKNHLEGHGLAWNLSQMEVLVGATLALSLSSTGRLEFPTTLTTLLKPEGYPATLPKPRATHGSCTLPLPCQIQQVCLIPLLLYYLAKVSRYTPATQVMLLDCLTLVARKGYIPESLGIVTISEIGFFIRLSSPGHSTDSRQKYTLVFLQERLFSQRFSLRDRLQVCHRCRGYRLAFREGRSGNTICILSHNLTVPHQYISEMT